MDYHSVELLLFEFMGTHNVLVGTPLSPAWANQVCVNANDPAVKFLDKYIKTKTSNSRRSRLFKDLSVSDREALQSHMDGLFITNLYM